MCVLPSVLRISAQGIYFCPCLINKESKAQRYKKLETELALAASHHSCLLYSFNLLMHLSTLVIPVPSLGSSKLPQHSSASYGNG
jgi:hypothetical protein